MPKKLNKIKTMNETKMHSTYLNLWHAFFLDLSAILSELT